MKFVTRTLIYTFCLIFIVKTIFSNQNKKLKSDKEIQIVQDKNGFNSNLENVVRKAPSVNTIVRLGEDKLEPYQHITYSSNSNTSNKPNVGWFGKNAEIVRIVLINFIL
jgi:hypothetical protein